MPEDKGWNEPGFIKIEEPEFFKEMREWILVQTEAYEDDDEGKSILATSSAMLQDLEAEVGGYSGHWTSRDQYFHAKLSIIKSPKWTIVVLDSDWKEKLYF